MKKKLTVMDLFSGCGGLSYGLSKAGFEILLGVDNWKDSLDTFEYNHPGARILVEDTSKLDAKQIKEIIGEKKVDVIVGGPPCQGFSLSGPRNFYDKRNRLYLDFLRIVKEVKPRAFLIENVPGLASLFDGQVKDRIIEEFSKLGYKVNAKVLNASDYGVPQNRRRIVFVGLKSGEMFDFPEPTHAEGKHNLSLLPIYKQKLTVDEAISDLPLLKNEMGNEISSYTQKPLTSFQRMMREKSSLLYNHVASKHNPRTVEIIGLVPEGGNYKMLPESLRKTRNFHVAWTRLHGKKPSPTIDTGHRHHFHPIANRVPTVRESARIQSFPDTFIFKGSKTSQYRQVGNAVPPILAETLGKQLRKYLEK